MPAYFFALSKFRDGSFSRISSSDRSDFQPYAAKTVFFDAAFARTAHPAKSDVLIIGDSLTSDIQGGMDYGLDTYWHNPTHEPWPSNLLITYEIRHLRELLEVLE